MSAPLVKAVKSRLGDAGYIELSTPFRVANVDFSFTSAMRGREGRALDLVLIFDTTAGEFGDTDSTRVRQRVEALSRALDVTASRYVITAILAGATLTTGIEALAEICRVLHVNSLSLDPSGRPSDPETLAQFDDQLAILLPLAVPVSVANAGDGGGPALEQLTSALSGNVGEGLLERLIAASGGGEEAVTKTIGKAIDRAFKRGDEKEEIP